MKAGLAVDYDAGGSSFGEHCVVGTVTGAVCAQCASRESSIKETVANEVQELVRPELVVERRARRQRERTIVVEYEHALRIDVSRSTHGPQPFGVIGEPERACARNLVTEACHVAVEAGALPAEAPAEFDRD